MPTISILETHLNDKLGNLKEDDVDNFCWKYGLELDEITSEYEIVCREQGEEKAKNCSKEKIYKIEVPANRCDLLCVEGLTRALMIFRNKMDAPTYTIKPTTANASLKVESGVDKIRPYVVAGILRNVKLTEVNLTSLISLQEKLHHNIGKKRQILAIGIHNLDVIKAPFVYRCDKPSAIKFVPLKENKEYTANEMMDLYPHLKPYWKIIENFSEYPVIQDKNGAVLSLPPIVNGNLTKIDTSTKNLFIEITGTNLHKLSIALDTLVTMFSEYCDEKFTIEPVEIHQSDGKIDQYPKLSTRIENVSVDYVNNLLGSKLDGNEMASLLGRMGLKTVVTDSVLQVTVPPTRHDVLHRCDIAEDVAISIGYDTLPDTTVVGSAESAAKGGCSPLTLLTEEIRVLMVSLQFTEVLSFVLCSRDDISSRIGKPKEHLDEAVHIANPKTAEFQVARTTLVPGILHTVSSNQHLPLPLSIFEVQDVVLIDKKSDVGASNSRHVCAVHYDTVPDFDDFYNKFTTVMAAMGYSYHDDIKFIPGSKTYKVEESSDDSLCLPGRSFRVVIVSDGVNKINRYIGSIGIIKPSILKHFGVRKHIASIMELEIECFL